MMLDSFSPKWWWKVVDFLWGKDRKMRSYFVSYHLLGEWLVTFESANEQTKIILCEYKINLLLVL